MHRDTTLVDYDALGDALDLEAIEVLVGETGRDVLTLPPQQRALAPPLTKRDLPHEIGRVREERSVVWSVAEDGAGQAEVSIQVRSQPTITLESIRRLQIAQQIAIGVHEPCVERRANQGAARQLGQGSEDGPVDDARVGDFIAIRREPPEGEQRAAPTIAGEVFGEARQQGLD